MPASNEREPDDGEHVQRPRVTATSCRRAALARRRRRRPAWPWVRRRSGASEGWRSKTALADDESGHPGPAAREPCSPRGRLSIRWLHPMIRPVHRSFAWVTPLSERAYLPLGSSPAGPSPGEHGLRFDVFTPAAPGSWARHTNCSSNGGANRNGRGDHVRWRRDSGVINELLLSTRGGLSPVFVENLKTAPGRARHPGGRGAHLTTACSTLMPRCLLVCCGADGCRRTVRPDDHRRCLEGWGRARAHGLPPGASRRAALAGISCGSATRSSPQVAESTPSRRAP